VSLKAKYRVALRLYPIFPLMSCMSLKDTKLPVGGDLEQKDPTFAPKGFVAEWSQYAMNRDPSVFDADVEAFNPDRWNTIRPGPWQYILFGGGLRNCLGQQKVLVEAAYTLMRLAARFEILESKDVRPWNGDVKMTCKNANGCKIALFDGAKTT
jgi:cytochrome P450